MTDLPPGALRWAVKDSFARYVRVIAAGTISTAGATETADGAFEWPLASLERRGDSWTAVFSGTVRFQAHNGFLDVVLSDPVVHLDSNGEGTLAVIDAGSAESTTIVTLAGKSGHRGDDVDHSWATVETELTEAGALLFGSVYPAGTRLAPLSLEVAVDY